MLDSQEQLTLSKYSPPQSAQCKKKDMGETKKIWPDKKLWTSRPGRPHYMGGKIQKKIRSHTRGTLATAAEEV